MHTTAFLEALWARAWTLRAVGSHDAAEIGSQSSSECITIMANVNTARLVYRITFPSDAPRV